jgi:ATP-binding cassette, subfamily B, bacterial
MRVLIRAVRGQLALAWRTDRGGLLRACALLLVGYLATPTIAVLLRDLTDTLLHGDTRTVPWLCAACAAALVLELILGHFAHLYYFEVGEAAEVSLQHRLIRYASGEHALAEVETPEFADTLALAAEGVPQTRASLEATLQLLGITVQTLLSTALLGAVDPWLVLLPVVAVVPVLLGRRAHAMTEAAREAVVQRNRLLRHLVELGTGAASVSELQVYGSGAKVRERQHGTWRAVSAELAAARYRAALLRALGQLCFVAVYGGALVLVIGRALDGAVGVGEVVLLITLALQLSTQVAAALGLFGSLQDFGRTFQRLDRLAQWPARAGSRADESAQARTDVPEAMRSGIVLERVSFQYPGADRPVLSEIDLVLPAGSTVALVGENGAGKSTLVKLLCGLYQPTGGRILVDGTDLRDLDSAAWSARIAPLFQDFARFQLLLRESVGVGKIASVEDGAAVLAAVNEAQAQSVVARVPGGLDGLLGRDYGNGAQLSGGQWQKLGLARTMMRREPLLLVLDEPAAALDATAEHALFERFGSSARRAGRASGAVTLFVSHRFSSVRIADRIVVFDGGRIVEHGTHEELTAGSGLYAELYALHARGYAMTSD